jgi:hypothetical protein
MGAVADWLGLSWHPLLLQPTFNRLRTQPNTSHDVHGTGVRLESLDAWTRGLPAEVVSTIEAELLDVDAKVRALADISRSPYEWLRPSSPPSPPARKEPRCSAAGPQLWERLEMLDMALQAFEALLKAFEAVLKSSHPPALTFDVAPER